MKMLKFFGGSISALYLVCVLFAVGAMGIAPSVLVPHANADAGETVAKVSDTALLLAANNIQVKAEPVVEQSIVDEAAGKIPPWFALMSSLVAVASAVTAVVPSSKGSAVLGVVKRVLDIFALNVWQAKSANKTNSNAGR